MTTRFRVGVLGELVVPGAALPVARQQRLILAALAAAAPDPVPGDRLIEGLWDGDVPKDARKALQVLVARLRRALSSAGVDVVHRPGGYALDIDSDEIDAVAFIRQLHADRYSTSAALDVRCRLLRTALALWRGEPFGELTDEPLLCDTARALQVLHDDAVAQLHGVLLDLGESDGLVGELNAWAMAHRLDEGAWCRLALGQYRAGRPAEALRSLHTHRIAVRVTAGVDPTSRLNELEAQILADQVPSRRAPQAGNLRAPTRSLVGRTVELRQLRDRLTPGTVTSLVGVGGVGKTVLALHACDGIAHRYRDGVWFCELADVATPDTVVDAVASTLGVRQLRGSTVVASLTGAFKDAEALIVLDNCEHVRATAAALAHALSRDCPSLTIVTTSREVLGVAGEMIVPVEPLIVADGNQPTGAGDAVELFTQRAREVGAPIRDDIATRDAVIELCRQLDGLPLAIELAAARARTMSVGEMVGRLDERFRLLTYESLTAPRRQQTLWDAVDWSYQLLNPDEQHVFEHLAVFLGGFDLAAAAAVTDLPLRTLEPLVWGLAERFLVRLVPATSPSRYQMLETLRRFGLDRLARANRLAAAGDRHAHHFIELADRAAPELRGAHEADFIHLITVDVPNLRAALQHAVTIGDADSAASLVTALHDYAEWRQFFELGTWARATLQLDAVPSEHRPALHAIAGWSACISGDFDEAATQARLGLAAEVAGGNECGWLHDVLAHVGYFQGDTAEGLRQSAAELDRARSSADPYRLSYVLADSAVHAGLSGDHALAQQRTAEALAIASQLGNPSVHSMAQLAKGFESTATAPGEATDWFRRATALADTIESSWTSMICRHQMAVLLSEHGDPHEAVHIGDDLIRTFRRAGDASRVRGVIRAAIPSIYRILGPESGADIVMLDSGTATRPHVREPLTDAAIAPIIAALVDELGPDAYTHAARTGDSLTDDTVTEHALQLIALALTNQ